MNTAAQGPNPLGARAYSFEAYRQGTLRSFWLDWICIGLTDDDLAQLEDELLTSPVRGDLVRETGGVRKVRFARHGSGKSGGVRVFYLDVLEKKRHFFLAVIAKNESANLSKAERNELAAVARDIKVARNESLPKTQKRSR